MEPEKSQMPLLLELYQQHLDQQNAAAFAQRVGQSYTPGTLERLTTHPQRKIRRAAVFCLGVLGNYESNQVIGRALLDEDRTVRSLAESAIRNLWTRCGTEPQRKELGAVIRLNTAQHYQEAIRRATALIQKAPTLAEAWHQRAMAKFSFRELDDAIRDAHETLELNPYHFPASAMMGQAYLELGNLVSALESFRRALRLYPDLEGIRARVARLARRVEEK
jgi:tetratricopeptide (TPR) repeat protein